MSEDLETVLQNLAEQVKRLEREVAALRARPVSGEWITTDEAAKRYGISTDSLFRARDRGDLKPVKNGRSLRWNVRELDAWWESQRQDYSRIYHPQRRKPPAPR